MSFFSVLRILALISFIVARPPKLDMASLPSSPGYSKIVLIVRCEPAVVLLCIVGSAASYFFGVYVALTGMDAKRLVAVALGSLELPSRIGGCTPIVYVLLSSW